MSLYPHYQQYVRHLYMYLTIRVTKDLEAINAERLGNNLKPLELNEEQLSEAITSLLNYIHDTEDFAQEVSFTVLGYAKVKE